MVTRGRKQEGSSRRRERGQSKRVTWLGYVGPGDVRGLGVWGRSRGTKDVMSWGGAEGVATLLLGGWEAGTLRGGGTRSSCYLTIGVPG